MTKSRKRRLVGMYLWLADKFRRQGLSAEAAATWNGCREAKLIDALHWAEGRSYLKSQSIPLLRRFVRMYLMARWPAEMIRKGSRTFMNVPTRPGAALRQSRRFPAGFYEFPA
jgi:hypothetical protein